MLKQKAGRKKLPKGEKRKMIRVFPKQKYVENCGGEDKAKQVAINAIENFKP